MILKKDKIIDNFFMIILLLCYLLSRYFKVGTNAYFLFILIEFILIVKRCKFSFFSIKFVCINYIVLALFFQYNYGMSYGILEYTKMTIYYDQILLTIFLYNFIWLLMFINTKILDKENKKIKHSSYHINDYFMVFLCICAIVSIIIAFPRAPFARAINIAGRFHALLPGNAWNHLTIICLIILSTTLKKSNLTKFTYLFCIFWFLSHYERVDIIGLFFGLLIIIFIKKNQKIKIKSLLKFGIPVLIVAVAMLITGEIRNNKNFKLNIENVVTKLVVQSTSADEAYTFNLAITYNNNHGNLYFKPYLKYAYNAIPLLDYPDDITTILKNTYVGHPGGEYLLSMPYMSMNILGVAIFSLLEFAILYLIINKKTLLTYFWYIFIMCTSFRIVWYGISYIEIGVLYIIPFVILLSKFFKKGIVYTYEEGNL